ncbi:MAG: hypothetical protein NTY81_01450 [Candidatus Staskawiczbacteria bacterium]|nr:hypothetical protein [Candidatus Staskawiczbacteria bacterium]
MRENTKKFLINSFGWGVGLWLIGYVLGIILFMLVPANLIGWVISPVGILITLWVLIKKTIIFSWFCCLNQQMGITN